MLKAAFLVEPGFLQNHFGVRNYFSTIKNAWADLGVRTDFIVHGLEERGVRWYKADVCEAAELPDEPLVYEDGACPKWGDVHKWNAGRPKQQTEVYLRYVGNTLAREDYDLAVLTNPWTVDAPLEVPARRVVGIAYDFIASMYTLVKRNVGYDWGRYHSYGYDFFNRHCDAIMAISEDVAEQYRRFYPEVDAGKISWFKPFVPYGISTGYYQEGDAPKEQAIILAAPFDLRKGLQEMPAFLNAVAEEVDTLYIYGQPRCAHKEFEEFFAALVNYRNKRIVFYPSISYGGLIELYKRCKFLLFPSREEGLGFPIIEAQVCGCRVIARDLPPMNGLIVSGGVLLKGNEEAEGAQIAAGLRDKNFSYAELSRRARERFLYQDLAEFLFRQGRFADMAGSGQKGGD